MLRSLRRYASLTYWSLSEALLYLVGRRSPYGILTLDIDGELAEEPPEHRLLGLSRRGREDYYSLVSVLRWAREDPHLRAVFIRCRELRTGWAKVQELRRSLAALRDAGKTVWVHLEQGGIREYVLASVAHRIILAPAGRLDITGLSSEVMFVTGALKKLGIDAELVQMGKYKSAAETFTRTDMSAPHREMVESLLDDVYDQVVGAIAQGRQMDTAAVCALLDCGPFVAREAEREHLVDALLYEDDAEQRLRAQFQDATAIEKSDYVARRGRAIRGQVARHNRERIGLLHVSGPLKLGESILGLDGSSACGSASVSRNLKELRERNDIGAVVIRISSPGGSGLASDLIWHEVGRTRERKPVVVSFGDVAASGGYYVGVAGYPVLAEAGTITGSIGVLAGKASLRGLYDRLGVTKEVVTRGRHAALYSDYVPLGDEERERLRTEAESFYATFIDRVAAGRQLSADAVEAVAQGRVWTGRQAQAHGLVDQLGGIETALDEAKALAGIPVHEPVAIERFPRPKRLWKLSFSLRPQHTHVTTMVPWLRFISSERVWALLPFRLRFF